MTFDADALALTLLAVLLALVIGIVGFVLAARTKARRQAREIATIRATIVDYFRRSGVAVSADCVLLDSGERGVYTAVVESEPMKRFRLSHIIEMTVREHVYKTCGLELGNIYWRFPIKEATQATVAANATGAAAAVTTGASAATVTGAEDAGKGTAVQAAAIATPQADETSDEYINEGLEHYRHIPRPEVTELPWETFEEFATGPQKKGPPAA